MNFHKNRFIYIISFVSLCATLLSGCKEEGCTDPSAINYNNIADKDDGSCIYCQTNNAITGERVANMYDNNFQSPFYGNIVSVFTLTQTTLRYNSTKCGENNCMLTYKIRNTTNKIITFTYNFSFSGSVFFNINNQVIIQPFETKEMGEIQVTGNPCTSINFSSLNADASGTITYQ